jgi:hypothetical protein
MADEYITALDDFATRASIIFFTMNLKAIYK